MSRRSTRHNIHIDADGIERAPSGYRCGQSHPKAKLTDEQVAEMRRMRAELGTPVKEIAARFGTSFWTVAKILRGERRSVEFRSYDD